MSILIGSTGFVGGHLQNGFNFDHKFSRSNISEMQNLETDFLVCAGLPAEKWAANENPKRDWDNMAKLTQSLATVKAKHGLLISTIDVYQPALDVTETSPPDYEGQEAYGRNRAKFEIYFRTNFPKSTIIRLPGLYGASLRKNFIFDLLNKRESQLARINKNSLFQYFDITKICGVIETCVDRELDLLNLATEPISAQAIADIFDFKLNENGKLVSYRMKTNYDQLFSGENGYVQSQKQVTDGIQKLKNEYLA